MARQRVLPVKKAKIKILRTILENSVTVISATTGSGKSTLIPEFLLATGKKVVITQPTATATIQLAERIASNIGCEVGKKVGYRTSKAKVVSEETDCLVVTDGLAAISELRNMGFDQYSYFIIDELHLWNRNIEILLSRLHDKIEKINCKLILMSATIEHETICEYFKAGSIVIDDNGYHVEEIPSRNDIITDIMECVDRKEDVLVFQNSVRDINKLSSRLKEKVVFKKDKPNFNVFELYGALDRSETDEIFIKSRIPKVILATSIAQTSITIPDLDTVIDNSEVINTIVIDGVETNTVIPISKDDRIQRKGRVGRTCPGKYIFYPEKDDRITIEPRPPEILSRRLDTFILTLAQFNADIETMNFYHNPDKDRIKQEKEILKKLGFLTEDNKITSKGKLASNLPLDVRYTAMLFKAKELGVLYQFIPLLSIYAQINGTGRWIFNPRDKNQNLQDYRTLITKPTYSHYYHYCIVFLYNDLVESIKLHTYRAEELRQFGLNKKRIAQHKDLNLAIARHFNDVADTKKIDFELFKTCIIEGFKFELIENHLAYCETSDRYVIESDGILNKRRIDRNSIINTEAFTDKLLLGNKTTIVVNSENAKDRYHLKLFKNPFPIEVKDLDGLSGVSEFLTSLYGHEQF